MYQDGTVILAKGHQCQILEHISGLWYFEGTTVTVSTAVFLQIYAVTTNSCRLLPLPDETMMESSGTVILERK